MLKVRQSPALIARSPALLGRFLALLLCAVFALGVGAAPSKAQTVQAAIGVARSFAATAALPQRKGPFGLSVISSRPVAPGLNTGSLTTDPTEHSRLRFDIPNAAYSPQVLFENIIYNNSSSEVQATTPITITADLECTLGVIGPLTFNGGATSVTIQPGGMVLSDPAGYDIPAGSSCWVGTTVQQGGSTVWPRNNNTFFVSGPNSASTNGDSYGMSISAATNASPIVITADSGTHNLTTGASVKIAGVTGNTAANGTWTITVVDSTHFSLNGSTGNGAYNAGTGYVLGVDLTPYGSAHAKGSGGVVVYGPTAIYGRFTPGVSVPDVSADGDSICAGSGDIASSGAGGWIARGLGSSGVRSATSIPFINRCLPGTTASQFAGTTGNIFTNAIRRMQQGMGTSYAFVEFGTNDLYGSSRTLAQLQADNLAIATAAARRGSRVLLNTITPHTQSSDAWATVANQSQNNATAEGYRQSYNTWVRCGAPIVSGAAVACGTSGAIVAGQAGHPIWKTIDPAQYVEVNSSGVLTLNGGFWRVDLGQPTTDGTHPASVLAAQMANAVPLSQMVGFATISANDNEPWKHLAANDGEHPFGGIGLRPAA